jgi:hypothetical protein
MAELEAGRTPSCSISEEDERRLKRLGKENVGVSPLFSEALKALEDVENLKEIKKRFDRGDADLSDIMRELSRL